LTFPLFARDSAEKNARDERRKTKGIDKEIIRQILKWLFSEGKNRKKQYFRSVAE
jgi:hypothetical protein